MRFRKKFKFGRRGVSRKYYKKGKKVGRRISRGGFRF